MSASREWHLKGFSCKFHSTGSFTEIMNHEQGIKYLWSLLLHSVMLQEIQVDWIKPLFPREPYLERNSFFSLALGEKALATGKGPWPAQHPSSWHLALPMGVSGLLTLAISSELAQRAWPRALGTGIWDNFQIFKISKQGPLTTGTVSWMEKGSGVDGESCQGLGKENHWVLRWLDGFRCSDCHADRRIALQLLLASFHSSENIWS